MEFSEILKIFFSIFSAFFLLFFFLLFQAAQDLFQVAAEQASFVDDFDVFEAEVFDADFVIRNGVAVDVGDDFAELERMPVLGIPFGVADDQVADFHAKIQRFDMKMVHRGGDVIAEDQRHALDHGGFCNIVNEQNACDNEDDEHDEDAEDDFDDQTGFLFGHGGFSFGLEAGGTVRRFTPDVYGTRCKMFKNKTAPRRMLASEAASAYDPGESQGAE